MAADWVKDYKIPQEYTHDGIVLKATTFPLSALQEVPNLETTSQDVLVASFPKSGTTWSQYILTLLCPEACTEGNVPVTRHVPFIEYYLPDHVQDGTQTWDAIRLFRSRTSPRLLKTHLPFRYFKKQITNDNLKVVFIVRNIKDALVSYFHFYKGIKGFGPFPGNWNDFFELFKLEKLCHAHFTDMVPGWLEQSSRSNVHVIQYEDMKKDPLKEIRSISDFLGKEKTEEELQEVVKKSSFDAMQGNPNVNYSFTKSQWNAGDVKFVRKGQVGGWQNYFTPEQINYVEDLMDKYPGYRELYPRDSDI